MKIVFATHNLNKLKEVEQLLPKTIELLSLADIDCAEEILETAITLEGNAKLKADYISKTYGYNCFADDTGLEVTALNGEPGVYSARYSGASSNAEANMQKLLTKLNGSTDRNAQFKTVIALNLNGKQYIFDGICKGEILHAKEGEKGFGYDPIFKPFGYDSSFAGMNMKEKGAISHRGRAVAKLVKFLVDYTLPSTQDGK